MPDTIDAPQRTLHFERTLDATPEEVFDAWTQAEQLAQWWDPTGAPLVECTIDARVGGGFRFVSAGHAPPFQGTYEVVERPTRLGFVAMGARGVVSLAPHARGTLMKVSITSPDAAHFEHFVKLGVHQGTAVTLDNLVRRFAR
ncbi:MAG: SRPBCC family protein [Myxococcota bacterium]